MTGNKKFGPMLGWISSSIIDAVGRIGLKVVATLLFARWLSPEIFGQASLTIVIVGVLGVIVTAPFEEALTQRKVIHSAHFSSSLLIVLCLSTVICALAMAIGWGVDFASPATSLVAGLVGVVSLILFAQGPIALYTAVARRHRAFKRIAWSNLGGDLAGTTVGLVLAYHGVGVWSLLAVRLVSRYVTFVSMVIATPIRMAPGFSAPHLRDLSRFASWFFSARLLDTVSDAVFQSLVARYFGLSGAGYLNMAMRIVEPIRGATGSMSHNIAMAFFVRIQDAPDRLGASVEQTTVTTALLLFPIFVGLAASGPTIIAVLAGPDWGASSPLVICLALAAALTSATNFLHTGLAARGRADLGFLASLLEFAVMVASLLLLTPWGLVAVGLARLLSYVGDCAFTLVAARAVFGLGVRRIFTSVAPIMLTTATMGLVVAAVGTLAPLSAHAAVRLLVQIVTGMLVYLLLASIFHRAGLHSIYRTLRASPAQ